MDGIAPLSNSEIEAWARLRHIDLDPLEVRALIGLDAVIRKPERDEAEKEPEPPRVDTPWPERN